MEAKYVAMASESAATELSVVLKQHNIPTEVLAGASGMSQIAALDEVDTVMAAIVGAAGLLPTMAAVKAGKRILLANKEVGHVWADVYRRLSAVWCRTIAGRQ